ncbi:PRD domain-containing protein [Kocuria sp. HSID16901]|uniref:PRD domain-containing protein n=1 Tax=Kocuria sp. HSID16901 TaxID=2419505 RepID=UPI0006601328|nr:PRD domain-containing protein [Kocuria sp. HSID16901]RUQ21697.1 PRD domain-containing protein [Kocuria sp. HSID16901]
MRILRIFNNNVVLAETDTGDQVVAIGRGLAFGKKKGQPIDADAVTQKFYPEQQAEEHLTAMLSEIPSDVLAVATDLEKIAREELGANISHSFILPLADHINYAIVRATDGLRIEYPLSIEVGHLYPKETAFGHRAISIINERLGVKLPEDEATPLALHLVNSQFATEDLIKTFKMTEVFTEIFGVISNAFGQEIDPSNLSVARFVTHLRYLFVRAEQGIHANTTDPAFPAIHEAVRTGYPRAYDCAYKVVLLLQVHLHQELSDDEHTYLAMHIARLASDLWGVSTTTSSRS